MDEKHHILADWAQPLQFEPPVEHAEFVFGRAAGINFLSQLK